jgi:hypothetical protein
MDHAHDLQRKQDASVEAPPGVMLEDDASNSMGIGTGPIPPVGGGTESNSTASASDQAFAGIHETADKGVSGGGSRLPYADQIAASFGPEHAGTVHNIEAHTGGQAAEATKALGAEAYAAGDKVAFAAEPSLHTAAHEAAHVVQQKKGGLHLTGGVGEAGDTHERSADEIADRVVAGKSAEDLLPEKKAEGGDKAVQNKAVQFIGQPLGVALPAGAEAPAHGEDADHTQRRYSVEQYEAMWEKEQGRKLTQAEKDTIARGCIGITANNIKGGGNPLQSAGTDCYGTFDQAHKVMAGRNKELHDARAAGKPAPAGEYILFAKAFWSNQSTDENARKTGDPNAYKPDPKTGKVDMSTYKYRSQPGFINFDYGFWDEQSQSFWHANHMQPGMKVYQSTKDRFAPGGGSAYRDFDRVIFCVALANNYDPGLAAINSTGGAP